MNTELKLNTTTEHHLLRAGTGLSNFPVQTQSQDGVITSQGKNASHLSCPSHHPLSLDKLICIPIKLNKDRKRGKSYTLPLFKNLVLQANPNISDLV